jgi:hypothetical protein
MTNESDPISLDDSQPSPTQPSQPTNPAQASPSQPKPTNPKQSITHVRDRVDGTRQVLHEQRLYSRAATLHQRNTGKDLIHLREQVQEPILRAKHIRGTHNRSPGRDRSNSLLAVSLADTE